MESGCGDDVVVGLEGRPGVEFSGELTHEPVVVLDRLQAASEGVDVALRVLDAVHETTRRGVELPLCSLHKPVDIDVGSGVRLHPDFTEHIPQGLVRLHDERRDRADRESLGSRDDVLGSDADEGFERIVDGASLNPVGEDLEALRRGLPDVVCLVDVLLHHTENVLCLSADDIISGRGVLDGLVVELVEVLFLGGPVSSLAVEELLGHLPDLGGTHTAVERLEPDAHVVADVPCGLEELMVRAESPLNTAA